MFVVKTILEWGEEKMKEIIESNNINFNMKNEGKEDIKKAHITKKKYTKRK